jgi:periplasmic divalent cation tolerance protein
MSDVVQIVTTVPDEASARRIARVLVERTLAACVQISGPIESIYRWQGNVESAQEWQCWIKTTSVRYAEVAAAIQSLHSYAVPEILALPVVAGEANYLRWLIESVNGTANDSAPDTRSLDAEGPERG